MRVRLTVAGLLAFIVVGAVTIWWFFAASFGERQLQLAQQQMARDGFQLTYGGIERSGFPLRVELLLHGVSIVEQARADGRNGIVGQAERVRFLSEPWAPQRIDFVVEGHHNWRTPTNGTAGDITWSLKQAFGYFGPRDGQVGWQFDLDLAGITATPAQNPSDRLIVSTAKGSAYWPPAFEAVETRVEASDIALPRDFGLGTEVKHLKWAANLAPLPEDLTVTGLDRWRQSGGLLTIDNASVLFGPVDGNGEGSIGLDEQRRPAGAVALRVREPRKLLETGAQAGWLSEQNQQIASLVLGLVSKRGADGRAEAALTFTMRDGLLLLAGLPLMQLQPLASD